MIVLFTLGQAQRGFISSSDSGEHTVTKRNEKVPGDLKET